MIYSHHIKKRMYQRKISSFMIDMILEFGDFNYNSQRIIIDRKQMNMIEERMELLSSKKEIFSKCIKEIRTILKTSRNIDFDSSSGDDLKDNLITFKRCYKKQIRQIKHNRKDLERMLRRKFTLVLDNQTLITVF